MAEIKAPLSVSIEVTRRCQLDCAYCFSCPRIQADFELQRLLDLIDEIITDGVFRIDISGDEPFLHPHVLDILRYMVDKEVSLWSVSSNGVLFSDRVFSKEVASLLRSCKPATHLQISIDSYLPEVNDAVRGRTADVIGGVENLITEGVSPTIATVLHSQNSTEIIDFVRYFMNLGVSSFHFMNLMKSKKLIDNGMWASLAMPSRNSDQVWQSIRHTFEGFPGVHIDTPLHELVPVLEGVRMAECIECHRCTAGFTHVVVLPDLNVVPCSNARKPIGRLDDKVNLSAIWNSSQAIELRRTQVNPCESIKWSLHA